MDVMEKLVELLDRFVYDDWHSNNYIAEKLIENGVTMKDITQSQRCESKNGIQTNAGHIQSMSISELNDFLRKVADHDDDCPYEYGSVKSLEWLKKPYVQKEYKKI